MHELPPNWQRIEFDDVVAVLRGLIDPRNISYADMLHVGPELIDPHGGAVSGKPKTAREEGLISGKFPFMAGDILYSKIRPNLNKVARPEFDGLCSADMYVFRAKSELCTQDFLFHLVQGEEFYRQAVAGSMRSGLPKVNRDDLSLITLTLPPPGDQPRLAAILNDFHRAISTLELIIEKKRHRKRALELKLLGPCLQVVPLSNWRELTLRDAFHERDERGEQLPLLSITAECGIVDRNTLERRDTSADDKSTYKVIRIGDIGYNTMRMWQGVSGLATLTGLISPAYTVVTPIEGVVNGAFAAYLFKLPAMIHRFWRYSQGMVDDQLQLRFEHFGEIKVSLPSLSDQEEIADLFDAIDREIDLLMAQAKALRRQKRGLMQKLLSGDWLPSEAKVAEVAE